MNNSSIKHLGRGGKLAVPRVLAIYSVFHFSSSYLRHSAPLFLFWPLVLVQLMKMRPLTVNGAQGTLCWFCYLDVKEVIVGLKVLSS